MNDAVPYAAIYTKDFYVTNEADVKIYQASPGDTVRLHSIVHGYHLWTTRKVYFYFGPTTTELELIRTKEVRNIWGDYDVWTDYTIPDDLEDGYYYFATRTEYESKVEYFWKIRIIRPPSPGHGQILVDTDPAGGSVYIDDKYVGTAPVIMEVDPGNHIVKADVGKDYVLKSCGCKECSMGEDNTCICTVEEGETITCTMKFEKVEEPAYMSALKYGMIGIATGLLLYALSQTKAKEYIVVPAKKVGGAIRERISS